jgi:hypothetical protein
MASRELAMPSLDVTNEMIYTVLQLWQTRGLGHFSATMLVVAGEEADMHMPLTSTQA